MDLIEDIGPILGIVAFLGFAILALLIVLQAREVRRLREWAGRAPERALEADEAALAAGEEKDEAETDRTEGPSRLAAFRDGVRGWVAPKWDKLDRRSPVHPGVILAVLAGLVVAAAVTGGFGLLGDDEAPVTAGGDSNEEPAVEVAVLNATIQEGVADPVPGIADAVAKEVVKPAGFKAGATVNAPEGLEDSIIMYEPEAEADAEALAEAASKELGRTDTQPMTSAVRAAAEGAPLALLVGFVDGSFGDPAAP
jgi:hypothetical protein